MTEPVVNNPGSLERLSDADYEIAPGEPDVRGWRVVLGRDEAVGEVDDLIIDPAASKVRYLDVDLDRDPAVKEEVLHQQGARHGEPADRSRCAA